VPAHPETSLLDFQFETLPHVSLAFRIMEDLDASGDVRALRSAILQVHEKVERALHEAVRCSESGRKQEFACARAPKVQFLS
jgi:hypothetical protein